MSSSSVRSVVSSLFSYSFLHSVLFATVLDVSRTRIKENPPAPHGCDCCRECKAAAGFFIVALDFESCDEIFYCCYLFSKLPSYVLNLCHDTCGHPRRFKKASLSGWNRKGVFLTLIQTLTPSRNLNPIPNPSLNPTANPNVESSHNDVPTPTRPVRLLPL